ncbi:hypothetical protein NHX12_014194 [Muraenolepis orangiensis]|uniref:Lysosome-associated membrane glycoprotein 2-like luminal domain-containing protein n=1 Tax=Muraenolepis orangiensis TaxID=630683 RepID=A0A9Q0I4Z6_9TELE|nr:hypothetical protein NHX12_014194 [Muraenolepis orangiensis]
MKCFGLWFLLMALTAVSVAEDKSPPSATGIPACSPLGCKKTTTTAKPTTTTTAKPTTTTTVKPITTTTTAKPITTTTTAKPITTTTTAKPNTTTTAKPITTTTTAKPNTTTTAKPITTTTTAKPNTTTTAKPITTTTTAKPITTTTTAKPITTTTTAKPITTTTTAKPNTTTTAKPITTTTAKPITTTTTAKPITTTTAKPITTTTAKPITTTTAKPITTTTAKPITTTTAKPITTTVKPTTHPVPTPPTNLTVGNYSVKSRGFTCLLAQMALQIRLVSPKVNGTFIVQPHMSNASGQCAEKEVNLNISFNEGFIMFNFQKNSTRNSVYVNTLSFNLTYPFTTPEMNYNSSNSSLHLFSTRVGRSYSCRNESIAMGNGLYLDVAQNLIQAFNFTEKDKFDVSDPCPADVTDYSVAIGVGVTLLVLILIVVGAYVVGRRRQASGYQSL